MGNDLEKHLIVRFLPSGVDNIYQLEYGIKQSNRIDVSQRLGDNMYRLRFQVIALAILSFLKQNPKALIRFSANDQTRMRLFTIWISSNWDFVNQHFVLYGYTAMNRWKLFEKNHSYLAITVKLIQYSTYERNSYKS